MTSKIKLQCLEGEDVEVDLKVAQMFGTIKEMLELIGVDTGSEPIPLPNVNKDILEKVIKWADHHKDDNVAEMEVNQNNSMDMPINAWDAEFMNVDPPTLVELILAAEFLKIKGLLNLACKTIVNKIKELQTAEAIREYFGLHNDFTPGELEQIKKQSEWLEEK